MKWGVLHNIAVATIAVGLAFALPFAAGMKARSSEGVSVARVTAWEAVHKDLSAISAVTRLGATEPEFRVIDGDTLGRGGERIRLHGIDAPELAQTCIDNRGLNWSCGAWSKALLKRLAVGDVRCEEIDVDHYGRSVAVCVSGGVELNSEMVRRGAAYAYIKYSSDYVAQQRKARQASVGLWRSGAQAPAEYRAQRREASAQTTSSAQRGCDIKGNISKSGRLYHLPSDHWYARTRVNELSGERWFCSEQEARTAGWRRAQG